MVVPIGAVGCDLDGAAVRQDGDGAVGQTGRDRAWEEGKHLLRQGGGRDIPVVDGAAEQRVAHASADIPRLKARSLQRIEHLVRPHDVTSFPLWFCLYLLYHKTGSERKQKQKIRKS